MSTRRLLFIDDNQDTKMLIKLAFEKIHTNWEVLLASDGIEGITKAESERPDAILLDVVMPKLDGFKVYEVLKSNLFTASIPVIFTTAMVSNKMIARLENTSAEGIITKPFDILNLDSQIAELCQWELGREFNVKR